VKYPTPFGANADDYIEACAQCYDSLILPGLGDVIRETWFALADIWIANLCDCDLAEGHHRWNCTLTPIWAQTIRDLDTNPWTVLKPEFGSWQDHCGRGPCCLGDGHTGRCQL